MIHRGLLLAGAKLSRNWPAWNQARMDIAYDLAIRVHLRASDNTRVKVPPMPYFLEMEKFTL
jgi:hypothetical protein